MTNPTQPDQPTQPMSAERKYTIYSYKHRAYYGPDYCGYTDTLDMQPIGLYTLDDARAECERVNFDPANPILEVRMSDGSPMPVDSHPTDTAETMPEEVRVSVGQARKNLAAFPETAVQNWSANAIRWLADDRERLLAALDKVERQRKEWKVNAGVYADIHIERTRQDEQWGGPEHDDQHEPCDWRYYRQKFEERAEIRAVQKRPLRDLIVKVAALAVAQIEAIDRASTPTAESKV